VSDWRKFLGKKERVVAAWLGGARVRLRDREVRLAERPAAYGFWAFEVEGRNAKLVSSSGERADPDFTGLPKVRGVLVGDVLFASGAPPERVELLPDDEPAMFASCTCHRWHDGSLLFGELDFEGEAEELARAALAERRGFEWEKGIPANLRAAFAWAIVKRVARERDIACSAREAWPFASDIAEGGDGVANMILDKLEELRHGRRIVVAGGAAIRLGAVLERAQRGVATLENAEERAYEAIAAAGGRVSSVRQLQRGQLLEVDFQFRGERFITLVHALTLQVADAGICLVDHGDGHAGDAELTLESLPSAIKEAMDAGLLVITRR
jgi:hypothetical protein